ncbi:hypothetical protein ACP3V3_16815 [Vibrio sp. PNB22_3_1]
MELRNRYRVMMREGMYDCVDFGAALERARQIHDRYSDGFATHVLHYLDVYESGVKVEESLWCRIGVFAECGRGSRVIDEDDSNAPLAIKARLEQAKQCQASGMTPSELTDCRLKLRRLSLELDGVRTNSDVQAIVQGLSARRNNVSLVELLAELGLTLGAAYYFKNEIATIGDRLSR